METKQTMKIQRKLLLLTSLVALVVMVVALGISSRLMKEALESAAKEKLAAVLEDRLNALTLRIEVMHTGLDVLATSHATTHSLPALSEAFAKLGINAQTVLQQSYLVSEVRRLPQERMLGTPYGQLQAAALPAMQRSQQAYDWADVFLIDPKGNVVFSVKKEADFATNLLTGPWKEQGLARAVTPLLRDAIPGALSFADFSSYVPSNHAAAAFLAVPVFDERKQTFLGVLAIQVSNKALNDMMRDRTGPEWASAAKSL